MTNLPYNRLAAFSLGVMTTVLLLAPSAKASCRFDGTSKTFGEIVDCQQQERQEREQRQRIEELERRQQDLERRLRRY